MSAPMPEDGPGGGPDREPRHPAGLLPVLVAAAGAPWEGDVLQRLHRAGPGLVLAKRCVDLADLLATAGTSAARVAVVSPALPGLDADSVAVLHRAGVAVVLVGGPEELGEQDVDRWHRLGIEHLLTTTTLGLLAETVAGAGAVVVAGVGAGAGSGGEPAEQRSGPAEGRAGPAAQPAVGRLLVVWGPTGAPGRTTVAVGIAAETAAGGSDVLLVDADAYGGTVAQHLGVLDEASGLLAAVRAANSGRLDGARLGGLARQVGDGLRVLTGLPRPDRWREVRPAAFDTLLEEAVRLAPYVVLDTGFCLESEPADPFGVSVPQRSSMTLTSLQRADEVVVVGAADPVGLARLARGLVELHELLPTVRPRVVVNRTRASLGWTDREIRGMVEGFVRPVEVHFLPEDRTAADRALMTGRSLVECGESALRTSMRSLAGGVLGSAAPHAPAPRGRRVRRRRAARGR